MKTKKCEKIIQLNYNDIKDVRDKLLKEQNGLCLISKKRPKRPVVDHHHKRKIKGTGLVRGVIDSNMNVFLAKIENNACRYGIEQSELPTILRNIADYLEREHLPYIHPTEKPKRQILTKSSYNKLKKAWKLDTKRKPKLPEYKTKNNKNIQTLTKQLKKLFNRYDIEPEFYK